MYAGLVLLPLACWPGLEHPFSTPKTWLLAGLSIAVLPGLLNRPSGAGWPLLLWAAAASLSAAIAPFVSLQALLVAVLPLPLCWAAREGRLDADGVKRAILLGSSLLAAVAVLQAVNLDPLKWLGWQPEAFSSARMRVYGTMGNPNFVAAWLCASLPLAAGAKNKAGLASLALLLGGILATGSRVFLLALPAGAAVFAVRRVPAAKWWCIAGVPVAAALLWLSPARPLGATVKGRLDLARAAASHLGEVPPAGQGPGALGQTHAHNDYLEFWVEYGPIGLCAFLGAAAWLLFKLRDAAALAAAVCLLAAACVDYPFHRPAEWGLFWLLAGIRTHKEN